MKNSPKAACLITKDDETEGVVFRSGHVMQAQKTAERGVVLA